MATAAIRAFFETVIDTWADAQSPAIPVAFENRAFTKPTTGNFLECFLIPATVINPVVSGTRKRELGILQVNCWGRQNVGTGAITSLAQNIVDLFPLVPKSATVSIEKTPCIERAIPDISGWYIIPVSITYRLET